MSSTSESGGGSAGPSAYHVMKRDLKPWDVYSLDGADEPESLDVMKEARVERFDKYESSLIANVSAAAQQTARATMQAKAQSVAQASATNTASFTARPNTTKPVKMSVPTSDGKDPYNLVFWVREIEIALSAGQIYDARAQVAFALSNRRARAHGPLPVKR
ncbi:unnamed protein product [Phytophthora fragariaefolia]|uniref:Unnamed protein product n=1 Tax=Phytophthora fragariaefolia TaxID=1490495 RepID=A0A9W6X8M4_9STRA|nr:unnamed protein product [Phytophthora fragariaefolia]